MIFLVFTAGFLTICTFEKRLTSAKIFALSYFFGASAIILEFFRAGLDPVTASYLSNIFYNATSILFAVATAVRYQQKIEIAQLVIISCSLFIGIAYYLHVDPNITARTVVANGCNGIIFGLAAQNVYQGRKLSIDKLLAGLIVVFACQFFVRVIFTVWFFNETLTNENYATSLTALSMQFIVSVAALSTAACLFCSYGFEIFSTLKKESENDPFTSLLNRRGLERKFKDLRERSIRASVPVQIILCDLDRFKNINDTYGHPVGDKVIRKTAYAIDETARKSDLTARIGGEEFCIIMWNSNPAGAKLLAESLRTAISTLRIEDFPAITLSCGITTMYNDDNWDTIFERADKALYHAKNTGRDRACVFGQDNIADNCETLIVAA